MRDRAPAFQFYPRQFAGDDQVMGMDLEAIGAHMLLICAAAASPERCRIYADEYAIRMRLRNPSDEAWVRIKKQLLAGAWKVSTDGKWWIQSGLERTFQKQKEFSERQAKKAMARWDVEHARTMPEGCRVDAEPMPEAMPDACSSSSSSSSIHMPPGKSKTLKKPTRKTGLPVDFGISAHVRAWARQNGHDRLDAHLEYFIGQVKAKGYKYVDWDQALMNAVRDDWAKLGSNGKIPLSASEISRRQQAGEEWRQ